MSENDVTEVVNSTMPEIWFCPFCGNRNETGEHVNEILLNHFKYIEQCPRCGRLHLFRLKMTDEFKKNVVDFLKNYF